MRGCYDGPTLAIPPGQYDTLLRAVENAAPSTWSVRQEGECVIAAPSAPVTRGPGQETAGYAPATTARDAALIRAEATGAVDVALVIWKADENNAAGIRPTANITLEGATWSLAATAESTAAEGRTWHRWTLRGWGEEPSRVATGDVDEIILQTEAITDGGQKTVAQRLVRRERGVSMEIQNRGHIDAGTLLSIELKDRAGTGDSFTERSAFVACIPSTQWKIAASYTVDATEANSRWGWLWQSKRRSATTVSIAVRLTPDN